MYVPQNNNIVGDGDSVIVLTDNDLGYTFGRFTGNTGDSGETFEIRVEEVMTGEKHTEWVHKEDLFKNTQENHERVKEMVQ
jgi:hypothetical protein